MKKFWICNQDEAELFETSSGRFNCGILELYGVFVVKVSTVEDDGVVSYTAGIFRDVQEAADAVAELKDFANQTTRTVGTFIFPLSSEPVTPIELLAMFEAQL